MVKQNLSKKTKESFMKKLFGAAVLSLGLFAFAGMKAMAATEVEDNGTIANANDISVNKKVTGNISAYDDLDWYKFTLAKPGTISLTFSHKSCENMDGTHKDWIVVLYNDYSSNTEYFELGINGGTAAEEETDSYNVAAGTYYLRIKTEYYRSLNTAEYGFKINYTSAIGTASEQENNDSIETANAIELNKSYVGRISLKKDVDWYKVTLAEPGTISLTFSHEACDNQNGSVRGWAVVLYDDYSSNTAYYDRYWSPGPEIEEESDGYNVAAGTYYLLIKPDSPPSFTTAEYGVKINYTSTKGTAAEEEKNDTIDTANEIELNKSYNGRISLGRDYDWYKVNLTESGTISLTFSHESCDDMYKDTYDWRAKLYSENNTNWPFFELRRNGGPQIEEVSESFNVGAGTYYLKIDTEQYFEPNTTEYGVKINFTPAPSITMLRLYNPNTGEHFYTSSEREKNSLVRNGWSYEGKAWEAPAWSNTPVYRLYNENSGDHHYTPSKKERDNLIIRGWKDEGIGWYSDDGKRVPLFRLYNPNAITGQHHYTTSSRERDKLVKQGWKDEGTGWYGLPESK